MNKELQPKRLGKAVALFAGVTLSVTSAACGSGEKNTPEVTPGLQPITPSPTETIRPTLSPEATPTLVSIAEPVSTPEKVTVPCVILPDEYCSTAERIEWKDKQGNTYEFIGFRLPPDVPIFSPIDGQVGKAKAGEPFSGFLADVANYEQITPTSSGFSFIGDLRFDNMLSLNIKKGDIIGYTQDSSVRNFENYNVIFLISRRDPATGKFYTPGDALKEYFPDILSKPIGKSINYEGQIKPTYIDVYTDSLLPK